MVGGLVRSPRLIFVALIDAFRTITSLALWLFAAGVRFLYGGEADEAIRFMDPVPEPVMSELDRELEVLKAIEGVDRVYESPKGRFDATKLNNNGVECRVALPDGESYQTVRKKCGGDCPDKVAAARNVKAQVKRLLGDAAVEAAEQRVQQVPPTKDPAGTLYEVKYEDDNRVRARCVGY